MRLAAGRGLTRNTLVQGAWSVLLARRSGRTDVCFGAMVACRPPELEGVEEIIGLLANTVPVRARLTGTFAETLTDLQARQRALVEHQHVALSDLERLTGRRPSSSTAWWCSRTTPSTRTVSANPPPGSRSSAPGSVRPPTTR